MAKITITIDGLEKHLSQLKRLGEAGDAAKMEAVMAGADVIAQAAGRRAPGPHIGVEIDAGLLRSGVTAAAIGPLKDYWYYRFFEYGTTSHEISPESAQALRGFGGGGEEVFSEGHSVSGMAARPFLRPAVDSQRNAVLTTMSRIFDRYLAKAVR